MDKLQLHTQGLIKLNISVFLRSLIFLIILLIPFLSSAQIEEKKTLRRAQRYFLIEDFERSAENYKMLADTFPEVFQYNYETALLLFYELDQKSNSIPYIKQAIKLIRKDSIPQLHLYLGQSYQAKGEYNNAIEAFKYYRAIDSNFIKISVTRYIQACELGKQLRAKANKNTKVENLGPAINTKFSEYTSVFLKNNSEMMFTSRRNQNIYDELIEALYLSVLRDGKYTKPKKIDSLTEYNDLVMDVNEFQSVVSISPDGQNLIIYYDPNLYSSEIVDGKWSKPKLLNEYINFNFVTTHASITADGKHIYFSCYDNKTRGNLDIYHSEKQKDGNWGTAERLPSSINTRRKEDSPEISPDGKTLYFSSDGLKGMGGFDVFKTEIKNGKWSKPENLGAPINSPSHDIYFNLHRGVEGTLSSNRNGGFGGMDIYRVFIPDEMKNPEFNNCIDAGFGNYEVLIDASESIDDKGEKVIYEWEFGDDEKENGYKVSHFYKQPGEFMVKLNVIDSISGVKEVEQEYFNVEINNVDYFNIDCDSIIKINEPVNFDASLVSVKDAEIFDVYWQVEPEIIKQGINVNHTYKNAGSYSVKIQVLYRTNSKEHEICIKKLIKVVNKTGL